LCERSAISSTYSHGQSQLPPDRSFRTKSSLRISGSARYTGSVQCTTCVMMLPWRMKCSTIDDFSLFGTPLRRIHSCLMCVVKTVRMSPSHLPVEKPIHVWGAHSGGCGRPSIQIVRSCSYVLT